MILWWILLVVAIPIILIGSLFAFLVIRFMKGKKEAREEWAKYTPNKMKNMESTKKLEKKPMLLKK